MRTREALTLNGGDSLNRGLVGFWPFNEASGPVVSDLSRFRRPGLITNTSTARIFQPPGRVISLDGTDDFVSIPQQNFPSGNQPYTFSGWVYWAASGSTRKVMTWGGTGVQRSGVYIGFTSNRIDVSHWAEDWTSSVSAPVAEWFHLVVTYDGTQDKIWVNGTFREAKTLGGALVVNTSGNNANAGRLINLNIEYFNGYFSNFRVWNRTLQPDEISRLYSDPWAGTARVRLPIGPASGTDYPLSADGITREYSFGDATFTRGRTLTAEGLTRLYSFGDAVFPGSRSITAEGLSRLYSFGDASITLGVPSTGDTHDGFKRRSRRERALDAAADRQRQEWISERNGLRLALEAAMGMAAEVVEDAPPVAVEAVQEAAQAARVVVPALSAPAMDLAPVRAALERLHAAVDEAARLRALAEDEEEVMMLLRAL